MKYSEMSPDQLSQIADNIVEHATNTGNNFHLGNFFSSKGKYGGEAVINLDELDIDDPALEQFKQKMNKENFLKLSPETQELLKNEVKQHLLKTLKDPSAKGFVADADGKHIYVYDEKTNTAIVINGEGGSIYRPPKKGRWLEGEYTSHQERPENKDRKIQEPTTGGLHGIEDDFDKQKKPPSNDPPDNQQPPPPPDGGGGGGGTGSFWDDLKRSFVDLTRGLGKIATKFTKILGPIGIVGVAIEGSALAATLEQAIDDDMLPPDAREEYLAILAAHALQATGDPTLVGGEAIVQELFREWADKYGLSNELREQLKPSHLTPQEVLDKIKSVRSDLENLERPIEPDMPEQVKNLATLQNQIKFLEKTAVEFDSHATDKLSPEPADTIDLETAQIQLYQTYTNLQTSGEIDVVTDYIEKERIFTALPDKLDNLPENTPPEIAALIAAKEAVTNLDEKFLDLNRAGLQEHGTEAKAVDLMDQRAIAKDMFNEQYTAITGGESLPLEEFIKSIDQGQNGDWEPITGDDPSTPDNSDSGWQNINDLKM